MDGAPLEKAPDTRNPRKVEAGRLGAKKGGEARAKTLSRSERHAIAVKAAATKWKGSKS
jgi:hypothetical protein